MFDFDKFIGSKFYSIFDYIYRFTIINLMIVLINMLTIVIFGFLPSLVSAGIIIKDIKEGKPINSIIKSYLLNFKNVYRKTISLNFIYILLLGVFLFNTYYFYLLLEKNNSFIVYFLMFFFLLVFLITFLSFLQCIFVNIFYPYLDTLKTLKYSFLFVGSFIIKNLVLLVFSIAFIYLSALFIYLVPVLLISFYLYGILLMFYQEYRKYITKENNYILTCEMFYAKKKKVVL